MAEQEGSKPSSSPGPSGNLEQGLERLNAQITCTVCLEPYKNPKVLPCLHYYCEQCIRKLTLGEVVIPNASSSGAGYVRCPKCYRSYALQNCDPKQLPIAHFVNEMLDVYSFLRKSEGGVAQVLCEMCDSHSKAVAFCRHCSQFACDFCAFRVHKTMRHFSGHEVVRVEDLTSGHVPIKKPPPMLCKEHEEEPLRLYCYDCTKLICRDCTLVEHQGHKFEFVKKTAPKCKEMLEEKVRPVLRIQEDISVAAEDIEKVKSEVEKQGAYIIGMVQNSFGNLIQILEQRQKELVEAAKEMVGKKMEDLEAQHKNFALIASDLQDVVDFVQRNLKDSSDEELMSFQKQMTDRVEEITQKYEYQDLQPAAKANIAVKPPPSDLLVGICKESMVYITEANPSRSTVDGPGIRTAEVRQQTSFTVRAIDAEGNPCEKKQDVVVKLKSLVNQSVYQAHVVDKSAGNYEVTYCPLIRGRLELSITVNNAPIRGSPFIVMVKQSPKQLGKPVKTLVDLGDPHAVVVNGTHVVVTEWGASKITFFDRDIDAGSGSASSFEKIGEVPLKQPTGITIDSEGYLYVVDAESCHLMKFCDDGTLVKKIGKKGSGLEEFKLPGGIRVFRDKIYICDRGNHRVQIFTTDLEYCEYFGKKGDRQGQFDFPVAAAFDKSGDLYVTDCNNERVQVFDRDGHYLRSFGTKGTDPGMLYRPAFIEIDGEDHVFVTEEQNHRVSVFQTNGVFITSFGAKGTELGKLDFPKGIFSDEDGFIYVCDHGNLRVQVF